MNRITIEANFLITLDWQGDNLIDWASAGNKYFPDGKIIQTQKYHFGFGDSAISSLDGKYAFIYKKLGTKGLLLKEGKLLREINRSYYCADSYEYPAVFLTKNGTTYLIHCPEEYCRIDIEEVESGKIITDIKNRKPNDAFHSRFELSPDNKTLLSKGWFWHPADFTMAFNIEECIKNPHLLDNSEAMPEADSEVSLASFINNDLILIGCPTESENFDNEVSDIPKAGQIAIWNFKTGEISKPITPNFTVGGNMFVIDEKLAWDLYDFPKIVNYRTGEVIDKIEDIPSGNQTSSIIIGQDLPQIKYNSHTKQVAISYGDKIELLTYIKNP